MIRLATLLALVFAASAVVLDRPFAAAPIPADQQHYTYRISTTNGTDLDAGTVHRIHYSGHITAADIQGSFVVAEEPRAVSEFLAGPFDSPLQALHFTLNGSNFDAPDNWKPVRIEVVELVKGIESRVVAEHAAWDQEFNSQQRSHTIFEPY